MKRFRRYDVDDKDRLNLVALDGYGLGMVWIGFFGTFKDELGLEICSPSSRVRLRIRGELWSLSSWLFAPHYTLLLESSISPRWSLRFARCEITIYLTDINGIAIANSLTVFGSSFRLSEPGWRKISNTHAKRGSFVFKSFIFNSVLNEGLEFTDWDLA